MSGHYLLSSHPSPMFFFIFRIWVSRFSSMKTPARSSCSCQPNMSKTIQNPLYNRFTPKNFCKFATSTCRMQLHSPNSSKFELPESPESTCLDAPLWSSQMSCRDDTITRVSCTPSQRKAAHGAQTLGHSVFGLLDLL